MELIITFIEPDTLHPNSNRATIADVANILEHKYHLLEKFCDKYKPFFLKRFLRLVTESADVKSFVILEQDIQSAWRDFIVEGEHGLTTKASQKRGSEPFIDTGAYFRDMSVKVEFTI